MAMPLRVLIVEESTAAAEAFVELLRDAGYEPTHRRVESPDGLAESLQAEAWDLVISDHDLPGFGALAALAVLRNYSPDLPFIVVSDQATEEIAVELMRQGAQDCVAKERLNRLVPSVARALLDAQYRYTARQASNAIEEALARTRAVLHHLPDGILTLDAMGRVDTINPPAESLFGWSNAEIIGRDFHSLLVEPHDALVRRLFAPAGRATVAYTWDVPCEVLGRRRDGSSLPAEMILSRMPQANGFGYLVSFRDISARKRTEEQMRQLQKMEAIGRFAAGVAHDFNNMLTATTGFSQLLLMKMAPNDPHRKYAEQILKACDHAAQLTRQLLAFSRKQVSSLEEIDLNVVLRQSEMLLRRLIGEDVKLEVIQSPSLGRIKADRSQIDQVIMNLGANARDAMPRGGTLTIETADCVFGEVEARERFNVKPGPYVLLAFTDTGVGMDAETITHIFEPFFTTKERGKGTGIGLATVYGIVEQSGGHIAVKSEPGRGARFEIFLPRIEGGIGLDPIPAVPVGNASACGTETILIAEDEEMVRSLVRGVLESCGYSVLTAANGEEALRLCRAQPRHIHLLVTDVVMPGINGYELARQLEAVQPGMKILYMSGHTESALLRHGVETGDLHFLQKPFSPLTLAQRVRVVLDEPASPPPGSPR